MRRLGTDWDWCRHNSSDTHEHAWKASPSPTTVSFWILTMATAAPLRNRLARTVITLRTIGEYALADTWKQKADHKESRLKIVAGFV